MIDAATLTRLAMDFLAGLIDGDVERMRAALHDDVTWSVPDNTAISGVAKGAEAVIDRARAINASDVTITFERVLHGLTSVALVLHNTGRRGDVELDEQVVVAFTVRGGRVASVDNMISDVAGLNAFFVAGGD